MDKKKALALQMAAIEENLEKKRNRWFFGIWIGYSVVTFWLLKTIKDIDSILDLLYYDPAQFFSMLVASAALGLISWWVNSLVWTNFCNSIHETISVYEKLEKEYREIP